MAKKLVNYLHIKNKVVPLQRFQRKALLIKEFWRGGRVVDCGGLENRCTARYPGFESLSLRNKGCKSSICKIYTLFYTQKLGLSVFFDF